MTMRRTERPCEQLSKGLPIENSALARFLTGLGRPGESVVAEVIEEGGGGGGGVGPLGLNGMVVRLKRIPPPAPPDEIGPEHQTYCQECDLMKTCRYTKVGAGYAPVCEECRAAMHAAMKGEK